MTASATDSLSAGRPPRSRSTTRTRQSRAAWLLALPFVVLFTIFTAWPVLQSVFMSMTDTGRRDLRSPFAVNFVGLDNFVKAFNDPVFLQSAFNTGYFVIIGVPLTMAVALAAAVALDRGITRLRSMFRLGFYTPVITSIVAVAVVWRFLLAPEGLVNTVLGWVGIDGPNWLGSTTWAMPSLIAMATWRNFGTAMIIFLAGLQGVPYSLHEAAAIDGAGAWQRFRHITLPLLRPTIALMLVLSITGSLLAFDQFFLMTAGQPFNQTASSMFWVYLNSFPYLKLGYGAALSLILAMIVLACTVVQMMLTRRTHT